MALQRSYGATFERLWAIYPKWPAGRSRKELAYRAYKAADKILNFTSEDIAAIEADIERRKRDCVTWQKGNKFGPVGMQVYFNQHLWNEPYEKIREQAARDWSGKSYSDEENARIYWNQVASKGGEVPAKYQHLLTGGVH